MADLEFRGTWDPITGIFPVIPNAITAAYYLVSGAGVVEGKSFIEGDWLIYIEENEDSPGNGTWYRASGGIIQLAANTENNPISITSSDIEDFGPAVSAAIIVDGVTIVKDPDTGALTVISGGGAEPPVIEYEPNLRYVAAHTHLSTDITDFLAATRAALGPGTTNRPFFSNTAVSNAVVFSYDVNLSTVSADVKIDNSTIIKNRYGQLVAAKPQPLNIGDIVGLNDYINNYIDNTITAENQTLSTTSPSNGAWYPSGYHNFGLGVRLGDALYLLNVDILDIKTDLANLTSQVTNSIVAEAPDYLGSSTVLSLDPSVTLAPALRAGTGAEIYVTEDRTPPTASTAPFYKGGDYGVFTEGLRLRALIDGASAGQAALDSSRDQSSDTPSGALDITEDQDSYLSLPSFHNLYRSIRARINPITNLSAGQHTYQLEQYIPDVGTFHSSTTTVNIDVPAPANNITVRSDLQLLEDPVIHYISGVPAINPNEQLTIAPVTVENVVGFAYGNILGRVEGEDTLIDIDDSSDSNELHIGLTIPTVPTPGTYGSATSSALSFYILDDYNENAAIRVTPYNRVGTEGTSRVLSIGRVDNGLEVNRVSSGDTTSRYPLMGSSGCGAPWINTRSLLVYTGELQRYHGCYRWPNGDFTAHGGPNYTGITGVSVFGVDGLWRWVTLRLATEKIGKVGFTLTFTGGNTATWSSDTFTKVTSGIMIFAKLGDSGWVNCNSPYSGVGLADIDGASSMVAGGFEGEATSATTKRITLGPSLSTESSGDLYVRVALPINSTKEFADILVGGWA